MAPAFAYQDPSKRLVFNVLMKSFLSHYPFLIKQTMLMLQSIINSCNLIYSGSDTLRNVLGTFGEKSAFNQKNIYYSKQIINKVVGKVKTSSRLSKFSKCFNQPAI